MAATVTTLLATNEYTTSVVSSVPALILNNGDEVVRTLNDISVPNDWTRIRLSFKYTILNSTASGNINNVSAFVGFCSTDKQFSKTLLSPRGENCVGWRIGNYGDLNPQTPIGITDPRTNPPNQNINFSYTLYVAYYSASYVSVDGGTSNGRLPRYETKISSSFAPSASMCGYGWTPTVIEMVKIGANLQETRTSFGQSNTDNIFSTVNIPQAQFHHMVEFNDSNKTTPYLYYYKNFYTDNGWTILPTDSSDGRDLGAFNENAGVLNNLNVYFTSSTAGVQLAIRDIIITKF